MGCPIAVLGVCVGECGCGMSYLLNPTPPPSVLIYTNLDIHRSRDSAAQKLPLWRYSWLCPRWGEIVVQNTVQPGLEPLVVHW